MNVDDRRTYSLGGGTKTAKTRHSGTVNRWVAVIFAHLVAPIIPLSVKFASLFKSHAMVLRLTGHTYIAV